jgi:hypothetical protein
MTKLLKPPIVSLIIVSLDALPKLMRDWHRNSVKDTSDRRNLIRPLGISVAERAHASV